MNRRSIHRRRNSPRYAAGLAALFCLGLVAAGCSNSSEAEPSENFGIGVSNESTTAIPFRVAVEEGLFKDEGLDVELVTFANGPAMTAGVISGDVAMATAAAGTLMPAQLQGQELEAAGPLLGNVLTLVVNRKAVPAGTEDLDYPASVQVLKGKRIGVPALGAQAQVMLDDLLTQAGMDPKKDITYLAVGLPQTAAASLRTDRVDAYITSPGGLAIFEKQGLDVIALAGGDKGGSEIFNGASGALTVTTKKFTNSGVFDKYCGAMEKTIAWMQDPANEAAGAKLLGELLSLDDAAALTVWQAETKKWSVDIGEENWKNSAKLVPGADKLGYADYVADCK